LEKAACGPQWASPFSDNGSVAAACAARAKGVTFAGCPVVPDASQVSDTLLSAEKNPARGGVFHESTHPSVGGPFDLCHDFGHEVVLLLLDAGADLVPLEGGNLGLGALEKFLNRHIGILHEGLTQQRDFT
jgi:hypothetical protein